MDTIQKAKSFFAKTRQKIQAERRDIQSSRGMDFAPKLLTRTVLPKDYDRMFYRNFLTAKQKRNLINQIRKANKGRLSEQNKVLIESIEREPKNIPYQRGRIPYQHAGNRSPVIEIIMPNGRRFADA